MFESEKPKVVRIVEPSEDIFNKISAYIALVKTALPDSDVKLIGSFAVPMCGKEEIDLLVETTDVSYAQKLFQKNGFSIGPIINGEGFCHNNKYDLVCELHIVTPDNKKILHYNNLITKLRDSPDLKIKYESLKHSLDGVDMISYKKEKYKFLKENNLV